MTGKEQEERTDCIHEHCTHRMCKKHIINLKPMHKIQYWMRDYSGVVGTCKKRGVKRCL